MEKPNPVPTACSPLPAVLRAELVHALAKLLLVDPERRPVRVEAAAIVAKNPEPAA